MSDSRATVSQVTPIRLAPMPRVGNNGKATVAGQPLPGDLVAPWSHPARTGPRLRVSQYRDSSSPSVSASLARTSASR